MAAFDPQHRVTQSAAQAALPKPVPALSLAPGLATPAGQFVRRASSRLWASWYRLIWAEWFAHRRLLLGVLLAWLATVWLVPVLTQHPLWILVFGVLYAIVTGPAFGGADIIDGCEEFMMSLPATRSERFLARMAFGVVSLAILSLMNLLAIDFNIPDVMDRIFLNTGLIQAVQLRQPSLVYGLVGAFPFTVFALGFAVAALARTRTVAFTSWLWGSLVALAIVRFGTQIEEQRWDRLNGRISVPALLLVGSLVLFVAWRLYIRKEAGAESSPLRIPLSWWGAVAAILLAAAAVGMLIFWFFANLERVF